MQHLQSQLAKYRQQIKENQAKIDSLTRAAALFIFLVAGIPVMIATSPLERERDSN